MKKYSKSFVVAAVLCCVLIFTCANAFAQDITINENIENSEIFSHKYTECSLDTCTNFPKKLHVSSLYALNNSSSGESRKPFSN